MQVLIINFLQLGFILKFKFNSFYKDNFSNLPIEFLPLDIFKVPLNSVQFEEKMCLTSVHIETFTQISLILQIVD